MKKGLFILVMLFAFKQCATAQKYFTKNGSISIFSKAPLEDISADNNQVMSVLNTTNGELQFSVLVKSFHFKKALMEEHFNSDYLESDQFPKSSFKGAINDIARVSFANDGTYNVTVSGDLTMHGITKKISAPGKVIIKEGKITGNASFKILLADYNISIPKLAKDNISPTIAITVFCNYDQKL